MQLGLKLPLMWIHLHPAFTLSGQERRSGLFSLCSPFLLFFVATVDVNLRERRSVGRTGINEANHPHVNVNLVFLFYISVRAGEGQRERVAMQNWGRKDSGCLRVVACVYSPCGKGREQRQERERERSIVHRDELQTVRQTDVEINRGKTWWWSSSFPGWEPRRGSTSRARH